MNRNLRHLRVFLEVLDGGSVTRAAARSHLSQPAVTQALAKLEAEAGLPLFHHSRQGLFPTPAGAALGVRVRRALARLDGAADAVASRLRVTLTLSQVRALIAAREAENFTLAARRLGISQPSVHRAISDLEREAGQSLFERRPQGLVPTRAARLLAEAARLALAELDQAEQELGELAGREVGRITVGAMPLARASLLGPAIAAFRRARPRLTVRIEEGSYDDLLAGLLRGETDGLVGAMRPAPVPDVVQEPLFEDDLVLVARPGHPLAGQRDVALAEAVAFPLVVNREGSPIRTLLDAAFARDGIAPRAGLVESGSLLLARQVLAASDHLACVSRLQAAADSAHGILAVLDISLPGTARPIGLTTRRNWIPTPAQRAFLTEIRTAAASMGQRGER